MEFGFGPLGIGATCDPVVLATLGKAAEQAGYSQLWVGDHPVYVADHQSSYPYTADGSTPWAEAADLLDPLMTLTYLAAHTNTIRLGTGVYLPTLRHPLLTAKQVVSLDHLSQGRFDFGIGVGWLAEEYRALDVPWSRRGARTDEIIAVMKATWSGAAEHDGFQGQWYQFEPVQSRPRPRQTPHPPLIIGGDSEAALRRVVASGDGWYGFNNSPDEAAQKISRLRTLAETAGRDPATIKVIVGPPPHLEFELRGAHAYAEAGVDQLVYTTVSTAPDEVQAQLDSVATSIISALA